MHHALQGRRGPLLDLPPELIGIPTRLLLWPSSGLQEHSPHNVLKIEHPQHSLESPRGGTSANGKGKEKRIEKTVL
jgi:hypothetical protein